MYSSVLNMYSRTRAEAGADTGDGELWTCGANDVGQLGAEGGNSLQDCCHARQHAEHV